LTAVTPDRWLRQQADQAAAKAVPDLIAAALKWPPSRRHAILGLPVMNEP
jgi:hypothetical protein